MTTRPDPDSKSNWLTCDVQNPCPGADVCVEGLCHDPASPEAMAEAKTGPAPTEAPSPPGATPPAASGASVQASNGSEPQPPSGLPEPPPPLPPGGVTPSAGGVPLPFYPPALFDGRTQLPVPGDDPGPYDLSCFFDNPDPSIDEGYYISIAFGGALDGLPEAGCLQACAGAGAVGGTITYEACPAASDPMCSVTATLAVDDGDILTRTFAFSFDADSLRVQGEDNQAGRVPQLWVWRIPYSACTGDLERVLAWVEESE